MLRQFDAEMFDLEQYRHGQFSLGTDNGRGLPLLAGSADDPARRHVEAYFAARGGAHRITSVRIEPHIIAPVPM